MKVNSLSQSVNKIPDDAAERGNKAENHSKLQEEGKKAVIFVLLAVLRLFGSARKRTFE